MKNIQVLNSELNVTSNIASVYHYVQNTQTFMILDNLLKVSPPIDFVRGFKALQMQYQINSQLNGSQLSARLLHSDDYNKQLNTIMISNLCDSFDNSTYFYPDYHKINTKECNRFANSTTTGDYLLTGLSIGLSKYSDSSKEILQM